MFQERNGLPFPIGKVVIVRDLQPGNIRGQHAHHAMQEIVVPLQGGCTVEMDDGKTKEKVILDDPNTALYIPAKVWRTLSDFAPDTMLLLIADLPYEESEKDYIRNYDEFLKVVS